MKLWFPGEKNAPAQRNPASTRFILGQSTLANVAWSKGLSRVAGSGRPLGRDPLAQIDGA